MQETPRRNSLSSVISEALARGATILAPNERAAADLRARFDLTQSAAGLSAWEPANIRSWNAWLEAIWSSLVNEGTDLRLLLNPLQEHAIWREIIATSPDAPSLGSTDALADLAQSAWRLAASYEATADLRRFAVTHDSRIFSAWAAAFARRCERSQYLSTAELSAALRKHIEQETLTPPHNLLLVGFDDDTPARTSLLTALATHGCTIERHTIGPPTSQPSIVRAATLQEETLTAAHWIRHFIETRTIPSPLEPSRLAPQQNPSRVALIVPGLQDERPALEATLRNILAPELQSVEADLSSAPYAFTTGIPLADTTMIATALDLIRWIVDPLPIDRVTALLLSPYIGDFASLETRAAFDAFKLRCTPMLRPEIDIARLNRLASTSPAVAPLVAPLAVRASRLTADTLRSHADWMEFIRDTLRDANWPGDRPLNAQEFRDARTWDHTLDAVATLDFTGLRVDFRTALEALTRQARAAATSSGSNDASVQIMTPAEAAGSSFDAVVFLRATDANWPTPERANPLLGWPLQHDRQMPGTDSARTAARAEHATQRLIASAPTVLWFYAEGGPDGSQRLSPLIAKLGIDTIAATDLITPPPRPQIAEELVPDTLALPPLTNASVRGGTSVLKLQAACSFHAFAEMRLNASSPETPATGFDARQLGNLLHRTMESFWRTVKTQQRLIDMPSTERRQTLQTAIDSSLANMILPGNGWDTAYLDVQRERLSDVLMAWLELELKRGPFTVLDPEQKRELTIGPLTLNVRLDRIDRIDGGLLLVDYKTGRDATVAAWDGPQPDEPQLPLYALVPTTDPLQGVAFATIRAGSEMRWQGFAPPSVLPKSADMPFATLEEQIEEWRAVLEQLARDFASGTAAVSPKEYPLTCKHCGHRLLCRISRDEFDLTETDEVEADA